MATKTLLKKKIIKANRKTSLFYTENSLTVYWSLLLLTFLIEWFHYLKQSGWVILFDSCSYHKLLVEVQLRISRLLIRHQLSPKSSVYNHASYFCGLDRKIVWIRAATPISHPLFHSTMSGLWAELDLTAVAQRRSSPTYLLQFSLKMSLSKLCYWHNLKELV